MVLGGASSTTNSITIPITTNRDNETGISSTVCEITSPTNTGATIGLSADKKNCVISSATHNTTYYYKVTTTNGAGTPTTVTGNKATLALGGCSIAITSDGSWAQSKTVTITKTGTQNGTLQYYVQNGSTTKVNWTTINSGATYTVNYTSTSSTPTYIKCRLTDGVNTVEAGNKTETAVDASAPELVVGNVSSTTNSITISITTNRDNETGISSTSCQITSPTNTGATIGLSSDKKSCVISNAKHNTTYYYKVTTTNGVGKQTSVTGNKATLALGGCSIAITNENSCAQSKTVTITKTGTQNGTLQYYVQNGSTAKVNWTTINSGATYTINYASNSSTPTYVKCRLTDGVNTVEAGNRTETKVDLAGPTVALQSMQVGDGVNWGANYTGGVATQQVISAFTASDDCVGVARFEFSTNGSTWRTDFNTYFGGSSAVVSNNTILHFWTARQGTSTFYIRAVDNYGNAGNVLGPYTINIDTASPVTTYYLDGSEIYSSYVNSYLQYTGTVTTSSTVTVTSYDANLNGVNFHVYRNGEQYKIISNQPANGSTTLSNSITFTSAGTYIVHAYATDKYGRTQTGCPASGDGWCAITFNVTESSSSSWEPPAQPSGGGGTVSCTVGASCGSCSSGYTGSKTYNSSCTCVDNCVKNSSSGGSSSSSGCTWTNPCACPGESGKTSCTYRKQCTGYDSNGLCMVGCGAGTCS